MDFGATIFFTDYSIGPTALGRALEERGFGSLWAPEHSQIPLSRSSPFPQGGELKRYRDAGVARLLFNLAPAKADEVLPVLDRCARLMRQGQS